LANPWREILTEICSLFAGISFASLLLVFQFKDSISAATTFYLAGSLSFSVIFFVFSALFCLINPQRRFGRNFHVVIYFLGFASFFVSLYLLLSLLNQTIAIISSVLALLLFIAYVVVAHSEP
jgi:peptidoglycan/LPS O-acetylase OafA/YrhL